MSSERSGSDTFVWGAILDSSNPYIGSATALPRIVGNDTTVATRDSECSREFETRVVGRIPSGSRKHRRI